MSDDLDPISNLVASIYRTVKAAGGRVDRVRWAEDGIGTIDVSGLPDGPLTEQQEQAIRQLAEWGITCRTLPTA